MVFEKPVIEKHELMKALDPIHGHGELEFERLQSADVLSTGVAPANGTSGRKGRVRVLYCALNRDAISALRRGHGDIALELGKHARRIEREQITPWLTAVHDAHRPNVVEDAPGDGRAWREWIDQALFERGLDAEDLSEAVLDVVREIAEVRERYASEDPYIRITVGRIWRVDETFTEVRLEEAPKDESFVVQSHEVFALGLRLGDPVVIRHEELHPGIFLTTIERGLEPKQRIGRVSGQPLPAHLEHLLDSSTLGSRTRLVPPLRQLA
jgi:hypothetical protein